MARMFGALPSIVVLLVAAAAVAAPAKYGTGVDLKTVTPVSAIVASPADYSGKAVAIKGLVVGVCAHSGCWMEIASDKPYEKIRVKVEDGTIVFPPDIRGKRATVQGVVETVAMCPEEATWFRQQEAKAKGIPFSPSMVTGKESSLALRVTGALIE